MLRLTTSLLIALGLALAGVLGWHFGAGGDFRECRLSQMEASGE